MPLLARTLVATVLAFTLAGCLGDEEPAGAGGSADEPIGGEGGDMVPATPLVWDGATGVTLIADAEDGLNTPRDLAFHPNPVREGELWIVNRADDSTTIVFDATTEASAAEHRVDPFAEHFMEEVSSIAFGARNYRDEYTFATCQESENTYNGQAEPNFFMGPALWTSDLDVYAMVDPIGLGSHLDMLHESPNCMGIAHEQDNVYWVFDGHNGKIVRYDFQRDHDAGYDDHADGIIRFMDAPAVTRQRNVPSHLVMDKDSGSLYVVDTGGKRVIQIDPSTAEKRRDLDATERGTTVELWDGATVTDLVPTGELLERPSGIALHEGVLYVSDNANGDIHAFSLAGAHLGTFDTSAPENGAVRVAGLMGIEVGPDGKLYFVDGRDDRVFRIERP